MALNTSSTANAPAPTPAFEVLSARLSAVLDQAARINGELLLMRGSIFGEGEPANAKQAEPPRPAGSLFATYAALDDIRAALDRAEEQVASLRKLG